MESQQSELSGGLSERASRGSTFDSRQTSSGHDGNSNIATYLVTLCCSRVPLIAHPAHSVAKAADIGLGQSAVAGSAQIEASTGAQPRRGIEVRLKRAPVCFGSVCHDLPPGFRSDQGFPGF